MRRSLDEVRRDTPGVANVIHLNNAGSALPPQVVLDTVIDHLRREAEIGGYEAAAEAVDREEAVYSSIATLIGADARQIATIENATRAWDMAVYGYPFQPGDRVLTARAEYASNVIALLQLRDRFGIEIVLVEDDEHGQISLEHLEAEMGRGAAMVALTHIPTNGGLVNPAEAVGALCAEHDVFYVLDACQSIGQVPVDVDGRRVRRPLGHRSQVPPGAAGDRLPLRQRPGAGPPRAAVPGPARRHLDRTRHLRDPGRRPAVRELGVQPRRQARPRRRGRLRPGLGARRDLGPDRGPRRLLADRAFRGGRGHRAGQGRAPGRDRHLHRRGVGPPRPSRRT